MLCASMALISLAASPALAQDHEGTGELQTYPNGLIVAILGIACVYGFVFGIVFNILRKRKKKLQKTE
jgi:hypothetical protein